MDVLDHSCSKLGFGGKMCIDGTTKYEEEKDESYESGAVSQDSGVVRDVLKNKFSEITEVNASLLKKEIPCLIISVEKNKQGHIKELHEQICALKEIEGMKMILYVEHTVDANDLTTALWRFCNNLDPKRDYHLSKRPPHDSGLTRLITLPAWVSTEQEKQKNMTTSSGTGPILLWLMMKQYNQSMKNGRT